MIDLKQVKDIPDLVSKAKWLEGKTLAEVSENINASDLTSRVTTKGNVGYVIEEGFFGIKKNNAGLPDIPSLGVEIKTCPVKYNKTKTRLSVKEPLSLNIINYGEEYKHANLKESSVYKKNRKILFIFYLHDKTKDRSNYLIIYVFLWEMDDTVLAELEPGYQLILDKIKAGKAHEIHQSDHRWLTLCPKHNGKFKDSNEPTSKRKQPFSDKPAEVRAFRLKNRYVNQMIANEIGKELGKGGWLVN